MPFGFNSIKSLPKKIRKLKRSQPPKSIMSDFVLSEWMMENTITNEQILSITLYAIAVYTLLMALCWKSVSNRRRLSWCISLLNSFLMSVIGAVHFVLAVSPLESSAFFGINGGQSVFHSMNNIGIFACTIFAVCLFAVFYDDIEISNPR